MEEILSQFRVRTKKSVHVLNHFPVHKYTRAEYLSWAQGWYGVTTDQGVLVPNTDRYRVSRHGRHSVTRVYPGLKYIYIVQRYIPV